MTWQLLGYLTLASQLGLGAWMVRWCVHTGRPSWTYAPPVPKPSGTLTLSSGADYVGYI